MAKKKEGEATMQGMLDILISRGVLADNRIANAKARLAKQQNNQKAYHNTELLLKHYRDIIWLMSCFPDAIEEELDAPLSDIDKLIDKLDLELAKGNRRVENRMLQLQKTRLMVDRINEALTVLRRKPGVGEKLYELIHLTYIGTEVLTHQELLFRLNISSRQYYRMREQSFAILSLRLWFAPDKDMSAWLEILALVEQQNNDY